MDAAMPSATLSVQFSFLGGLQNPDFLLQIVVEKKNQIESAGWAGQIEEMEFLPTHQQWVLPTSCSKMECCLSPWTKMRFMVPPWQAEYHALIHQEPVPGSRRRLVPKDPRIRCLSTQECTTTSSGQPSTTSLSDATGWSRCLHPMLRGKISSQAPCSRRILRIGTSTRSFQRESLASSTWTLNGRAQQTQGKLFSVIWWMSLLPTSR